MIITIIAFLVGYETCNIMHDNIVQKAKVEAEDTKAQISITPIPTASIPTGTPILPADSEHSINVTIPQKEPIPTITLSGHVTVDDKPPQGISRNISLNSISASNNYKWIDDQVECIGMVEVSYFFKRQEGTTYKTSNFGPIYPDGSYTVQGIVNDEVTAIVFKVFTTDGSKEIGRLPVDPFEGKFSLKVPTDTIYDVNFNTL